MSDLEQDLRIEAFLNGDLSEEEQLLFKKQIDQNSAFAERLALHRIQRLMKAQMLDDYIEEKLAEWHRQHYDTPPSNTPPKSAYKGWINKPFLLRIAGVTLFSLIVIVLFMQPPKTTISAPPAKATPGLPKEEPVETPTNTSNPTNKKPVAELHTKSATKFNNSLTKTQLLALVDQYAMKNPDPGGKSLVNKRTSSSDSLFSKAFNTQDNKEAIALYEQLNNTTENPLIFHVTYNLGLLYFEEKNYQKAIECFSTVSENKDYENQNQAQWMLAMSYLANNQIDDGKNTLQEIIANPWHQFNEEQQASKLLSRLNEQ